MAPLLSLLPYGARIKADARDRVSEHLNGQIGQRPKSDARTGRSIVSRVGVIEPESAAVPGRGKIGHRAVVLYPHNTKIAVAVLNSQLGAAKQCLPVGEIPRNVPGGKEGHAVAIWS